MAHILMHKKLTLMVYFENYKISFVYVIISWVYSTKN